MPDAIPEPPNGTIVGWYDINDDLYVVMHRDDEAAYEDQDGGPLLNWWFPVYDQTEEPRTWEQACADLDGFRGPVVLVPAGESA